MNPSETYRVPFLVAVFWTFAIPTSFDRMHSAWAGPKPNSYWSVDDVRAGMKGIGRTVMKGTKVEPFDAEVLGVLKNTSPGRDLVLCRLSGLNLDRTGVIAGMSGSPIHIDGKLLGAVAYAWQFGKEPIAGVTPFCQMHGYVESYERRDLVEQEKKSRRVGLREPVLIDGTRYDSVVVAPDFSGPQPAASGAGPTMNDTLWMTPLRTPVAATGFTAHSLGILGGRFRDTGLLPMQGGSAAAAVVDREKDTPLEPGGPLAISMVQGDFDLSGIGTVTHIEGSRVYGWGHPFMSLGACEFPLMTGFIHTVYPRQTVSFKMGSPLKAVGVINADVSTGIAGWLHRKPDLIPVRMSVAREQAGPAKTFNVQIVRQRTLLPALVHTVLTNSVDMEGDLPEELTADLDARIEIEGKAPIEIKDTFSGPSYSGGRAPVALYLPIAAVVNQVMANAFQPVRVSRIECATTIRPGRITAEIESVELDSEIYSPGETVKATVFVRPYKSGIQAIPVTLSLPADLPEGPHTATVGDDLANVRQEFRDNPTLSNPKNVNQVLEAVRLQTSVKRNQLVVRLPLAGTGVALGGVDLPNLPASMVQILGNTRRTGAQPIGSAVVSRKTTPWVVQGSETIRFTVAKNKKVLAE